MTESRARGISLSWGDGKINLALPRPNLGSLLLVEQDKREFRGVLLRMVADELVAGRPVHWIRSEELRLGKEVRSRWSPHL